MSGERGSRGALYASLARVRDECGWSVGQVRALARARHGAADARGLTVDQLRDLRGLILAWRDLWHRCVTMHIPASAVIAYALAVDPSVAATEAEVDSLRGGPDLDRTKMTPDLYDTTFAWMDGIVAAYDDERAARARALFQAEAIGGDDGREAACRWLSAADRPRDAWLEAARVTEPIRRGRLHDMLRARHGAAVEAPLAVGTQQEMRI